MIAAIIATVSIMPKKNDKMKSNEVER